MAKDAALIHDTLYYYHFEEMSDSKFFEYLKKHSILDPTSSENRINPNYEGPFTDTLIKKEMVVDKKKKAVIDKEKVKKSYKRSIDY